MVKLGKPINDRDVRRWIQALFGVKKPAAAAVHMEKWRRAALRSTHWESCHTESNYKEY